MMIVSLSLGRVSDWTHTLRLESQTVRRHGKLDSLTDLAGWAWFSDSWHLSSRDPQLEMEISSKLTSFWLRAFCGNCYQAICLPTSIFCFLSILFIYSLIKPMCSIGSSKNQLQNKIIVISSLKCTFSCFYSHVSSQLGKCCQML